MSGYKTLFGEELSDYEIREIEKESQKEARRKKRQRKQDNGNHRKLKEFSLHKFVKEGPYVPIMYLWMNSPWQLPSDTREAELFLSMVDDTFNYAEATVEYCVLPDYTAQNCPGLIAELSTAVKLGYVLIKYATFDGTDYYSEYLMVFARKGCFEVISDYVKTLKQKLIALYEGLCLDCRLVEKELLIQEGFLTEIEADALEGCSFDNTKLHNFNPQIPSLDRLLSVFAERKGHTVTVVLTNGSQIELDVEKDLIENFSSITSHGMLTKLVLVKSLNEASLEIVNPVNVDDLTKELNYAQVRERVFQRRKEKDFDDRAITVKITLDRIKEELTNGGRGD